MNFQNVFATRGFRAVQFAAALALPAMAQAATGEAAPVAAASEAAPATGGVFEPATQAETKADPQFRSLFLSWKKLDQVQVGGVQQMSLSVSIPSVKPVSNLSLTSNFGFRSDPFKGGRAMHAGVDIPGPIGTPIYATADGLIGRAQRLGGYGNYIEIEHGQGIQTRYGHLSSILVKPMSRVKRGQLIGLMGSTGRSTGSHLHYEVRLDGRAVNPMPFLQSSDYITAMNHRGRDKIAPAALAAMGGSK